MKNETIEELENKLRLRKSEELQKKNVETERLVLEKLNTLIGKCYMKNCQGNQKLFYKFLGIKHKTKSQANNTLLEVVLTLDRIIHCQIAEKNFNRGSTVSHHFQDSRYMDLEIQKFTLYYNKETGVFDFNRSVSNFILFLTEISEELYQSFLKLTIENENKSEELIKKYNIK